MQSTSPITSTYCLNGWTIDVLGLSAETEERLRSLGISTLEQLARLAVNRSGVHEHEATIAIQCELAARLAPRTVWCFSSGAFAAHFVIHADNLFFFKASVIPDDPESWTCTYQWYVQEDRLSVSDMRWFHDPSLPLESSTPENMSNTPTSPPFTYQSDESGATSSIHETSNRCTGEEMNQVSADSVRGKRHEEKADRVQRGSWDSYDVWNHAIATYVTVGVQHGSTVYLSIDDEVIEQIKKHLHSQQLNDVAPFLDAVKQRVVQGRRIVLDRVQGRNQYGEPNCIAFLSSMVLAASRMAEDEEEEISSSNYFARFCEVLGLDQDGGRPRGMKAGSESEEPLWHEWIVWLGENGLISSARRGEGAKRYISYPISQALLRGADRDRLRRLFRDSKWNENWDVDTLVAAVRREAQYLTKHLQTLLNDQSQRATAIAEAIYEVYEAWRSGESFGCMGGYDRGYNLLAGLWRTEDLLRGTIEYFLYPRTLRRQQFDTVIVDIDGQQHRLIAERSGWYRPICAINVQQLNQGARYPITQPEVLEALILPRRAFWILCPDPDNPDSGVYASWGEVPLGTPFIILCRHELLPDLERLRAERLIEWDGDPQPVDLFPEWVEVRNCMVISPVWDGVEIEHRDLHHALRPKERLSIGLAGGLRAPQGGWLAGFGPQVTVFGFPVESDVRITPIGDDQVIFEETKKTNQPFNVPWSAPGDYLIEAVAESPGSRRLVKIVDWDNLAVASIQDFEWLQINGKRLCGALVQEET